MNDAPRTFFQVLRLYQLVTERLSQTLAPMGLTPNQFTVLSMVRLMAPATSAALARRIGVTAQSAGETVKILCERGLVNRDGSPDHKRLVLLTLSATGRRLLQRADKAVVRSERELFGCLDSKAFAEFERSLLKVRTTAARESSGQRASEIDAPQAETASSG